MKVTFVYDREKDIWCLLNKGKSSRNSSVPTPVYTELISEVGENPGESQASGFIDTYLERNNINTSQIVERNQKGTDVILGEFQMIAEKIFGVSLNRDISAYLTINNRCPYDLKEGWFFVSMSKEVPMLTVMHELWHFYTWERFGANEESLVGAEKYNELKEALTVLINSECAYLLPAGSEDKGYPQHQELRDKMKEWWSQSHDIQQVWEQAKTFKK